MKVHSHQQSIIHKIGIESFLARVMVYRETFENETFDIETAFVDEETRPPKEEEIKEITEFDDDLEYEYYDEYDDEYHDDSDDDQFDDDSTMCWT